MAILNNQVRMSYIHVMCPWRSAMISPAEDGGVFQGRDRQSVALLCSSILSKNELADLHSKQLKVRARR